MNEAMVGRGQSTLSAAALTAVWLLLLGCGARTEYLASSLDIDREGWDSVQVDVAYASRMVIGGGASMEADSTVVTLFNARYDTLYSGAPGIVPIQDAELGDEERLMVEACGMVKRRQICVQESLRTSPKRVSVVDEIFYPRAGDPDEGSYELAFQVERRDFHGNGWESIDGRDVSGRLLAWVDDPEAKTRGIVTIPFSRPNGRFNLSSHPNYKNFKYYLDSELLDNESARVTFEVHAGLDGVPFHLASTTKEVKRKTEDDREREVRFFAEQATEKIIDELDLDHQRGAVIAYVEDWRFDSADRHYVIEIEIEWEGRRFDRGHHRIEGAVEVGEDGSDAIFQIESGNRRAARKWRSRMDSYTLQLGGLDVHLPGIVASR